MWNAWDRCLAIAMMAAVLAACGGGGDAGSGGGTGTSTEGAPLITASLAVFAAGYLPAPAYAADGGNALLMVSVSDAAGAPGSTTVQANGRELVYDSTSRTYRRWLVLSTREQLSLTVTRGTQSWQASSALIDVYPQIVSPRQPDNFPTDFAVTPDAVRSRPLHVSWTGELPSTDHRWAMLAMDAFGQISWPARDRFELLADAAARSLELPAGALNDTTIGFVAAVGRVRRPSRAPRQAHP